MLSPADLAAPYRVVGTEPRSAQMMFSDPALLAQAQTKHAERLRKTPYQCPLPDDVKPPLVLRPEA